MIIACAAGRREVRHHLPSEEFQRAHRDAVRQTEARAVTVVIDRELLVASHARNYLIGRAEHEVVA